MQIFNPFEDIAKAATVPPQGATVIRALVPTGRNVGHGLDLHHVKGHGKHHGGQATRLERYGRKSIKGVSKSVSGQLMRISAQKAPSRVPREVAAKLPGVGPLARRQRSASMQQLRGSVASPSGSTGGRRMG